MPKSLETETYGDYIREALHSEDKPSLLNVIDFIESHNHGTPNEKILFIDDLIIQELAENYYKLKIDYLKSQRQRLEIQLTQGVSWNK